MIAQQTRRMAYSHVRPEHKRQPDRNYYGTPPEYIEMARRVMGSIELDPASCQEANDLFVRADRFYDETDNGLVQPWNARTLFLNPPYSRQGCRAFAEKFAAEAANIRQAVVLVNSATGTRAFRHLFDHSDAICFLSHRIQFMQTDDRVSQQSNSKEQLFFYRGPRVKTFARIFGRIGYVVRAEKL